MHENHSKHSPNENAKEKKKRKPRKIKDPDAPKRPLGGYFFYFKEHNARIREENPEFIQKAIVAKIAKDWKQLSEEEKQPYIEKSNEDKLRYMREKEAYDRKIREECLEKAANQDDDEE